MRHLQTAKTLQHRPAATALTSIVLTWLMLLVLGTTNAFALKPIAVNGDLDRLEITNLGDVYDGRGDSLQLETAPGPDGAAGRMSVRASTLGTNPNWLAFALSNPTDKTIELWLTADRYNAVGSGVIFPDLDARRIAAISNSSGFAPERIKSDRADIFRVTIERGQTITYVAELTSDRFARLYLWKPLDFEQKQRDRQLFNGIMLGIAGLLAVFLTAVFAANHKAIFPSAALVAWAALALLCVDFGFWHKLFQMKPEDNAQYRAVTEAAFAASLIIFMFAFLRVNLWNGFARLLFLVWIAGQLAVVVVAILDPRLAATIARLSMPVIGTVGTVVMLYFAARGLDRALALIPTWIMFLVWQFGAATTLTGKLSGEFVVTGLIAGLVLIVVLIGFTVTQFAFRSGEPIYGANASQQQLRLAAIDRAGVAVWEWSARRDEIRFDAEVEGALGLGAGELPTKIDDFVGYLHPTDKERLLLSLSGIKERAGGVIHQEVRLRHADSSFRWFELEGASIPTTDHRQLRCVGLARDITDEKRAQERLMHDAVHDSLTGLPNRGLFFDRLGTAIGRAKTEQQGKPTVFFFDIDKFRSINSSFGLIVGDSILLTVARRLARNLQPNDTLARISGDQFALLTTVPHDPQELATLAERLRLALRSPIRMAGQEIILTGSIGVALFDGMQADGRELVREAETAMFRAKRAGSDRIEIFRADMRGEKDARIAIESDLRRAIDTGQLTLLYQPIVALSNEELVGFEALVRWQHPKLGMLSPADFVPVAEETDLIVQLGSYVLTRAVADIGRWQKELPRPGQPLFVSVNISSRQLIKPDLVQEIRHLVGSAAVQSDTVRLEITESLVMENPEQASHILDLLKEAGVHLALDDFGTGYSSLAYLNRFPFDTIKIDRALVQSSGEGDNTAIIVRSIVALAHELGKKIVAEGIETPEDAAFLRSIGAQYAQGFHYGEPMSVGDVSRLLKLIRKADRRMRRRGLVHGAEKRRPVETVSPEVAIAATADAAPSQGAKVVPLQRPAAATVARPATPSAPAASPASNGAAVVVRPMQPAARDTRTQNPPTVPASPIVPRQPQPVQTPAYQPPAVARATTPPPAHPDHLLHNLARKVQASLQANPRGASAPPASGDVERAPPAQPAPRVTPPPALPPSTAALISAMTDAPATSPPASAADPAAPSGAMRRPVRRANLDALPPGIAARLAKLAGNKAAAAAPVATEQRINGEAPVPGADKTAAE